MMAQEHAFSLAVENIAQCVIPVRAKIIRVLFSE
jgi:NADH:ubiquinone oxidoreductase subunit D